MRDGKKAIKKQMDRHGHIIDLDLKEPDAVVEKVSSLISKKGLSMC